MSYTPADEASERTVVVRLAVEGDAEEIAAMVDDFVKGHPAENHPRSLESLRADCFGSDPVAEIVVAERGGRVVAMAQWQPFYDMFWGARGGRADWLYVKPEVRGLGVWAAVLAKLCERVREGGGRFLYGQGTDETGALYERFAIMGPPYRDFHLGGNAFETVADLVGLEPREIVARLPDEGANRLPSRR